MPICSFLVFKISWSFGYQKGLVFMLHQGKKEMIKLGAANVLRGKIWELGLLTTI